LVKEVCVTKRDSQLCQHLIQFYSSVDTPPHIFWTFNRNILPSHCKLAQRTSISGDVCHYEIRNLSNGEAKRLFNLHVNLPDNIDVLKICNNGEPRKLRFSDLDTIED